MGRGGCSAAYLSSSWSSKGGDGGQGMPTVDVFVICSTREAVGAWRGGEEGREMNLDQSLNRDQFKKSIPRVE
jgi:hypothetical protein